MQCGDSSNGHDIFWLLERNCAHEGLHNGQEDVHVTGLC